MQSNRVCLARHIFADCDKTCHIAISFERPCKLTSPKARLQQHGDGRQGYRIELDVVAANKSPRGVMRDLVRDEAGHRLTAVMSHGLIEHGPNGSHDMTHVMSSNVTAAIRQAVWKTSGC